MHFRFCAGSGASLKIIAVRCFPLFIFISALFLCLAPPAARAQKLNCNPCTNDFRKVRVGKSISYSFLLENPSGRSITILSNSIHGTGFSFGYFPLPATIGPRSSLSLPVLFTPPDGGEAKGDVTIKSDAENSPLRIDMSGRGAGGEESGGQLAVSPASLSFGSVPVGSNSTAQATLTASNAAVTITSDSSTNAEFAIVGMTLPVTIKAGQNLPVTIQFSPSASGNASGKAQFTSNAENSPAIENLTGVGVAQQNRELTISPSTLNFGNVTVGSNASLQATLTAPGASVTISSDQVSSEFAILGLTLPVTLQAGQSLPVTIQFSPSASGAASGTAQLISNAENSPTAESLTGTGVAQTSRELSISPSSLNFGDVTVGSSASLQATLTAPDAAVTISSDQVSPEFAVLGMTFPVTIKAGQSLPVTIQFTPSASGAASGKAQFISNAQDSPTSEALSGTGEAAGSHSVSLSWDPGDGSAVGYNIYRGTSQSGPYEMINTALDSSTDYTDSTVVSGTTYFYVATEVNAEGKESPYSNVAKAVIPK
jgi:hypothetical protein